MSNKYVSNIIEATANNRLVGLPERILSRMDEYSLPEKELKGKNHNNKSFQQTANAAAESKR